MFEFSPELSLSHKNRTDKSSRLNVLKPIISTYEEINVKSCNQGERGRTNNIYIYILFFNYFSFKKNCCGERLRGRVERVRRVVRKYYKKGLVRSVRLIY